MANLACPRPPRFLIVVAPRRPTEQNRLDYDGGSVRQQVCVVPLKPPGQRDSIIFSINLNYVSAQDRNLARNLVAAAPSLGCSEAPTMLRARAQCRTQHD